MTLDDQAFLYVAMKNKGYHDGYDGIPLKDVATEILLHPGYLKGYEEGREDRYFMVPLDGGVTQYQYDLASLDVDRMDGLR